MKTACLLAPACSFLLLMQCSLVSFSPPPALMEAVVAGDAHGVKRALARGAEVNAQDEEGQSPLHIAVAGQDVEIVHILLKRGADPNALESLEIAGRYSVTPMHIAANNGFLDVMKLLLDQGGNVDARSATQWTPLHDAAAGNQAAMIRLLVERGADVEARSDDDETPLQLAAGFDQLDAARALLDLGADVNAGSQPALHIAAAEGFPDMVKLLLERGADPNGKNRVGHTAIVLPRQFHNEEVIRLLEEAGAAD